MTRPPSPLGRCLSCGMPLTLLERMYVGDRFCADCDAYQSRFAVVDAWRTMADKPKEEPSL